MFGTVIQDAYTKDETSQIVEALNDLCNPHKPYGWSGWNLLFLGLLNKGSSLYRISCRFTKEVQTT
ncbi:hypothetical protein ACQVU9_28730 [Bacillus paranthracis]